MSKYFPEPDNPPDMVSELQRASRMNQRIDERFQVLTGKLYRSIAEEDWVSASELKKKLIAIEEILTDV
jgi:hypothetical protein